MTTHRHGSSKAKETEARHKPPLGSGERFRALEAEGKSPALAAWIGRKKYGAKKFAELSAHGRKH